MADKHLAYDTRKNTDLFSDDDPLAELARIVGFEPRVAANTVAEAAKQEPAFDLEDELLREFERYDAPRPLETVEAPVEPVAGQSMSVAEADFTLPQPEPIIGSEAYPEDPQIDALVVAAQDDAQPQDLTEYHAGAAAPISGARDLIEELEMSIGAAAVGTPSGQKAPQWSAATIRLPLANFHRASTASQGVVQQPAPVTVPAAPAPFAEAFAPEPASSPVSPEALGFPAEVDRHEEPHAEVDAASVLEAEVEVAELAPLDERAALASLDFADHTGEDVRKEAAQTDAHSAFAFDIDDLLNDVSKYPVPRQSVQPQAAGESSRGQWEAAVVAPVSALPEAPVLAAPVVAAPVEADDPFSGHDFEMDLEGIELELADLDFAEPVAAPARVQEPKADHRAVEPVSVAQPAPKPVVAESAFDDGDLGFDPAMFADAEHHPEAVEMHIPSLPPVEHHEPARAAHDFDLDVDAEIANLLAPVPKAAPAEDKAAKQPVAPDWLSPGARAGSKPQATVAGYDEFEKALEEDFRRSVAEPMQRKENVSQLRIESAGQVVDKQRARSMKRMLAATASILVFAGIAYAGYSFVGKGSIGLGGGEPKVILADKDPVKVVPDNPGGKTVPNQDKAVYDSVGGALAPALKQKALVSNDEQPVDVVQKTLTPEISPEDDSGDVATGTPVGETEDPRLLPSQVATSGADSPAEKSSSMGARKVRTMIVKPDGTLVPREEIAGAGDDQGAPPVRPVQSQKIGQAADVQAASTEIAANGASPTPMLAPATPVMAPQAPVDSPLAKVAAANPANVDPPIARVQSAPVKETAPVPSARPARAPATAATVPADEVKPKPAQPVQPAKEVASIEPAAATSSGGYGVQIASLPSEDEAKRSYNSLSSKFGGVIAGKPYEIRKVDIAGKGTYYRLRVKAGSKDEAADICVKYRAAGGTCIISK